MTSSAVSDTQAPVGAQRTLGMLGIALVAMLVAAAILSYLDRLAITTLGPDLSKLLKLNKQQWGWMNSAFSLVYIFTSLLGGWWVDRVGVRTGLLVSTLIWGAAAMGHALATGFYSLCFWRMLLALGEGPGMAAMVKGTRRLMPPRWRDFGNGLMNAGWAIGALIAPLVVDWITRHFHSWQMVFLMTGGLCFLWIPLWIFLSWRRAATLGPEPIHLIVGSDHRPQRLDIRSWCLWAVLAAIFFTVPPTVFVNSFLSFFFHDDRGLAQEQFARLMWQPFLAADIGQIAGGLIVYALLRFSWRYLAARRIVMIVGFGAAACLAAVNFRPDISGTLWCINASRLFFQMGYIALVAYGIESVGEGQSALMAGVMNATFSACNLVFNPLIGGMADHFHSFKPVIVMISLTPILGLACWIVMSQLHVRARAAVSGSLAPVLASVNPRFLT